MNPPHPLATLAHAAWLGWKVESNWADAFVFCVYVFLKPLAAALTIIVMCWVVTGGTHRPEIFAFAYLGSAFHLFFTTVLGGASMVVIEDREFYETLHYVYISPARFLPYLLGRCMVRFAVTSVSVLVVVATGVLVVGLPIDPARIDWPLLGASLALGLICLTSLGVAVGGATLLLTHRVWYLMDAISGALLFFSGTIFPVSQLPEAIRWISFTLPTTYWMDLVRRALAPGIQALSPLPDASPASVLALMAFMTAVSVALGLGVFTRCAAVARRWGYIHRKTHF